MVKAKCDSTWESPLRFILSPSPHLPIVPSLIYLKGAWHAWEDTLHESVFSFHHMGLRKTSSGLIKGPVPSPLYLLNHYVGPLFSSIWWIVIVAREKWFVLIGNICKVRKMMSEHSRQGEQILPNSLWDRVRYVLGMWSKRVVLKPWWPVTPALGSWLSMSSVQHGLHNEFQTSQGFTARPCLENKQTKEWVNKSVLGLERWLRS